MSITLCITYIFTLIITVLYCTVLYCTVLYCTVLYCTVLYCTVLYCTLMYCTVLYFDVLYCTVLYCTLLYCTVPLCSVLFSYLFFTSLTLKLSPQLHLYDLSMTEEGVFHVTSTPKGFFVNRCTRSVFDPRPAPNPHFSHELFNTLLDVSTSLRVSWQNLCVNASEVVAEGEGEVEGRGEAGDNEYNGDTSNSGALDVLTALFSQVSAVHIYHLHDFSPFYFTSC